VKLKHTIHKHLCTACKLQYQQAPVHCLWNFAADDMLWFPSFHIKKKQVIQPAGNASSSAKPDTSSFLFNHVFEWWHLIIDLIDYQWGLKTGLSIEAKTQLQQKDCCQKACNHKCKKKKNVKSKQILHSNKICQIRHTTILQISWFMVFVGWPSKNRLVENDKQLVNISENYSTNMYSSLANW